eukprot:3466957-Rhodomonas_salina.1
MSGAEMRYATTRRVEGLLRVEGFEGVVSTEELWLRYHCSFRPIMYPVLRLGMMLPDTQRSARYDCYRPRPCPVLVLCIARTNAAVSGTDVLYGATEMLS